MQLDADERVKHDAIFRTASPDHRLYERGRERCPMPVRMPSRRNRPDGAVGEQYREIVATTRRRTRLLAQSDHRSAQRAASQFVERPERPQNTQYPE